MVLVAADLVGDAVVADINQDVKIGTADGFVDLSFCFAGTETRALAVNQKRILGISGKGNPVAALGELFTELNQIRIDFFAISILPGRAASFNGATGMEFSSKSKLAIQTSSNRHILQSFSSYLYHRNKGRVKQKTKESLLFVQVVVIIMNECPLAMQSSAAFRTENEGKGKAIT